HDPGGGAEQADELGELDQLGTGTEDDGDRTIVWPVAAAAAPTPSQAAAPDRECAGPIMVFSRPQRFGRPSPVRRGQVETAAYRP
ncbi:hypothetical protein AB0B51_26320, partial [Streptomyces griseus]|uniref:hypothetical protein n=1 Tax=Streptomyces griseus TaxID=1911 RepID=UPI0033E26CEE